MFPAAGILHRQRRDDRLRRCAAAAGRPERKCLGDGHLALGHGDTAGGVTPTHYGHGIAMDKVFIEGLQIDALIGIYDWERRIRQPLVFDIEMAFDNRIPAASDAIDDTLNYKAVSKRV